MARTAWEELGRWELIVPVSAKGEGEGWETRMWRIDVTLEELGACVAGLKGAYGEMMGKWCREI